MEADVALGIAPQMQANIVHLGGGTIFRASPSPQS